MGLFRSPRLTGQNVLLAAMQDGARDIDVATYGADGQRYLARLSDDETAYVVYRETFLGWCPEGCAVSVSGTKAGPWEAHGSTSHLGTHESLGGVLGAIHADVRSRLAEEEA